MAGQPSVVRERKEIFSGELKGYLFIWRFWKRTIEHRLSQKSDSREGEEMAQAGVRECDQSEVAEVEEWRLGQLLAAGYDEGSAWILAKAHHVDLHRAVELVTKRGCSPEMAKKILL